MPKLAKKAKFFFKCGQQLHFSTSILLLTSTTQLFKALTITAAFFYDVTVNVVDVQKSCTFHHTPNF